MATSACPTFSSTPALCTSWDSSTSGGSDAPTPYVDIALLLVNARGTWPDEDTTRQADDYFADRYGIVLDLERQDFYLRLDPLTW